MELRKFHDTQINEIEFLLRLLVQIWFGYLPCNLGVIIRHLAQVSFRAARIMPMALYVSL